MRRALSLAIAGLFVLLVSAQAQAQTINFTAALHGGNEVPGVVAGTIFSVAALALVWDTDDFDLVVDAYRGGHYVGAEAGHAIDRKTGRAYKWVPGQVSVKLEKVEE